MSTLPPDRTAITRFIDGHLSLRLTIAMVATGVGLPVDQLRSLLGPRAGFVLRDMVSERRAATLQRLIRAGEKVESAMRSVGLRNWNNVVAQCRRHYGCLPHELRTDESLRRLGTVSSGVDLRHQPVQQRAKLR